MSDTEETWKQRVASVRTYKVRYDHVLMAQGFDSSGGGMMQGRPSAKTPAGDNRVGSILGDLSMRTQLESTAPTLENEGSYAGVVNVVGAAAWDAVNMNPTYGRELRERKDAVAAMLTVFPIERLTLQKLEIPPGIG